MLPLGISTPLYVYDCLALAYTILSAETEDHEGKRKTESLWPIFAISHARSRYIYDIYTKRDAITKELYNWLIKEGYADAACVLPFAHSVRRSLKTVQANSKMEKAGLRKAVLREMCTGEGASSAGSLCLAFDPTSTGHELCWVDLHLPSTQSQAQG